jgi:predicted nucleic acid-binding protein
MIYLDTSAILKLLVLEHETVALGQHLGINAGHEYVTSALGTVETARILVAIGRADDAARAVPDSSGIRADGAFIGAIAMSTRVLDAARSLPPAVRRSLDAIHLATAAILGPALDHVITYDKPMVAAAEAAGLRVESPS